MPTTATDTAYAGRRGGDGVGHRGLDSSIYLDVHGVGVASSKSVLGLVRRPTAAAAGQ